jgi:hypothetical protein
MHNVDPENCMGSIYSYYICYSESEKLLSSHSGVNICLNSVCLNSIGIMALFACIGNLPPVFYIIRRTGRLDQYFTFT